MDKRFAPSLKGLKLPRLTYTIFRSIINESGAEQLKFANSVLDDTQRAQITEIINNQLAIIEDAEKQLRRKIAYLVNLKSNESRYDANRKLIQEAMRRLFTTLGRMPSQIEVARDTGLSRQTVNKHINDQVENPEETIQQYRYMGKEVLDNVLDNVLKHNNMHAARIYLERITKMEQGPKAASLKIFEGELITQEMIDKLDTDEKKQLMCIITNANTFVQIEAEGEEDIDHESFNKKEPYYCLPGSKEPHLKELIEKPKIDISLFKKNRY
ncbi:MAG TPA: hypothetical protein VK154_10765 [Chitinophagales bacterium]|nr:hypothetical protein [Chitinophagales bacterium]